MAVADPLLGSIKIFELDSEHTRSKRKLSVYLPPKSASVSSTRPLAVVYMADGGSVSGYAKVIEPLILAQEVAPLVIVGVHQGGYLGELAADRSDYDFTKDLRAAEYLPALESEHFAAHERFFCEEVLAWAEREFGVSDERGQRAILGTSNGGRFVATMGVEHPDLFGHVFAFSIAAGSPPAFDHEPAVKASYHLAAGAWETRFHDMTMEFASVLSASGFDATFSSRVSGHDELMWQEEFGKAAQRAFRP